MITAAYAQQLDAQDELAPFRNQFVIDEPGLIYLLGNSLGRLPKPSRERAQHIVEQEWGNRLIRSWNEGWFYAPEVIGNKIGGLLGARPGEVIVADSTSINLYKLALAALLARPGRNKIITDDLNFPSDLYILQGLVQTLGGNHRLEIVPSTDGVHGAVDGLSRAIDDNTALVALSHTVFKSGYIYDMAAINQQAHAVGALTLWDLSHSAGSVPVDLSGTEADLAVGCSYKYLNGGPGAPAFLYVRQGLQGQLQNPIPGWMGQEKPFEFGLNYRPVAGLRRFVTGTPSMLSLALIEPGVDLLLAAGMDRLRAKSVRQTEFLIALWEEQLALLGFVLRSPRSAGRRGSHLALAHPEAYRISRALIQDKKVLPDFRKPDNLRLAVAPLYTSYSELYEAVMRMKEVVSGREYEKYPSATTIVT